MFRKTADLSLSNVNVKKRQQKHHLHHTLMNLLIFYQPPVCYVLRAFYHCTWGHGQLTVFLCGPEIDAQLTALNDHLPDPDDDEVLSPLFWCTYA